MPDNDPVAAWRVWSAMGHPGDLGAARTRSVPHADHLPWGPAIRGGVTSNYSRPPAADLQDTSVKTPHAFARAAHCDRLP